MNPEKISDKTMELLESRFRDYGPLPPLPPPIEDGEIPVARLLREAGLPMHRLPDQGAALAQKTLLLYKRARRNNPQATIYRACQIVAELVNGQLKAPAPPKAARKAARKAAAQQRGKSHG